MLYSGLMNFSPWVSDLSIDITLLLQQETQNFLMPVRITLQMESDEYTGLLRTPQVQGG
jgi:hypothetical protein